MKNKISNKLRNRIIFRLVVVILIAITFAWLAIFNGLEFANYKWHYSENNMIKAGQYLIHVLWGISFGFSPALWLIIIQFSAKFLLPKEFYSKHLFY